MAHLQYMPGDPRLVDQLVYELKSKGIFDQFRKDCIADVDTRPAYQNLRQRVESSVSTFLSRQCWQPDLNKNQLREKLRKHILDGNYLEQGVERIVDQVVNPKVASVFIPQVEDLVYNYLGVTRKKTVNTNETKNDIIKDLLPTDLEAVSPGSVKSNDDNDEKMEMDAPVPDETKMEVDQDQNPKVELKNEDTSVPDTIDKEKEKSEPVAEKLVEKETNDACENSKSSIPMPADDCKVENIPPPEDSPRVQLEKIELPKVFPDIPLPDSIIMSADIPLPDEIKDAKDEYFKPINSDEDESSSDSSLRRNMSPLTPIRNFNNENSCDAQQAFDNDTGDGKNNDKKELNTFRFAIDAKTTENNKESIKTDKKEIEQTNLAYQFNNQVNINNFNTPLYEDSSNSNNLQIDYESDANSKAVLDVKVNEESVPMEEVKKDRKAEDKKSSHKSSHRSRDTSKHSSSKEKRSDSKPSNSRDTSRHDKKSSRDDHSKSKSSHKDKSSDKSDKKDSDKKERDSSRHRSSHKSSSHKDSKDSKSHKSSSTSSSQRHSSKYSDEKKSSSSSNNKEKSEKYSERSSEKSSKDRLSKDSKSSSNRSDKDRKSSSSKSSSKHDEKDKDKKSKKETDDHYSVSGRGNSTRRSTDRDSNDGSSSSKGSHNPASLKSSSISQKDSKGSSSKSENTSPSGDSTSPSDKEQILKETKKSNTNNVQSKPIVRVDTRLELPMASPPRLPFVPDVTLKKPKFAANLEEAKKLMRMRRFLDEEQKRMNQEAALLLEFQANVRPSLSQVYSSIPGPELEFACVSNNDEAQVLQNNPAISEVPVQCEDNIRISNPTNALLAVVNAQNIDDITGIENELSNLTGSNNSKKNAESINETEAQLPKVSKKLEATQESEQITVQIEEDGAQINNVAEARVPDVGNEIDEIKKTILVIDDSIGKYDSKNETKNKSSVQKTDSVPEKNLEDEDDDRTEYFEITVIAEELSESEETQNIMDELKTVTNIDSEVNSIEEPRLDNNNKVIKDIKEVVKTRSHPEEEDFRYFTSDEQSQAVVSRDRFSGFLQSLTEKHVSNKVYLINCDTYEESVVKGVLESLGTFEVVNYHRNGHLKLPKTSKSIIKNVNVASEVSLPFDNNEFEMAASELEMDLKVTRQTVLSPVKSECSFELSSDYDAKLTEMVNNTSRQEIMEIILGNAMCNESPSKMPTIDYVHDCNIDSEAIVNLRRKIGEAESESTPMANSKRKRSTVESKTAVNSKSKKDDIETEKVTNFERHVSEIESESEAVKNLKRKIIEIEAEDETLDNLKRKINEIESSVNNNRPVLTPKKLRKMSASDQITSTTQESESPAADTLNTRSKYLGRARRVGLPRPRKTEHPNSPSSDKSVENYSQNATQGGAPVAPNGKLPARNKIQRYDTSDLYKPKLHYLSRRNNIS